MCVSEGTSVKWFLDKNLFERITERKAHTKTRKRNRTKLRLKNIVKFTSDHIITIFIQYLHKDKKKKKKKKKKPFYNIIQIHQNKAHIKIEKFKF